MSAMFPSTVISYSTVTSGSTVTSANHNSIQEELTAVQTEVSTRTLGLSTEVSTRDSADLVLSTNISTEVSLRTSADLVLSSAISTEVSTRASADLPFVAKYGGMYSYNKSIAFGIYGTGGYYHAFHLVTAGDIVESPNLSGWTFYAGRVVENDIDTETSNGAGSPLVRITTIGDHNLVTGDIVTIVNANNAAHNKKTKITYVSAKVFDCDGIPYVGDTGASAAVILQPAHLKASTGSAGMYHLGFVFAFTGGNGKSIKIELNKEVTDADWIAAEKVTNNNLDTLTANGTLNITDGDRVWLSFANLTDATDITVKHANINLHRI